MSPEFPLFIFLSIIFLTNNNCPRENPIFNSELGICTQDYCTEEDFKSQKCQINNTIIETQWLNNIININKTNFRYLSFATYSNGDMIFQSNAYPKSNERIFLGFKKNGRSFFNNNSYFYNMNVIQSESFGNFEFENIVIKLNEKQNNQKEYLLSLPTNEDSYVEIYDFENNIIYQKMLCDFAQMNYIDLYKNVAISLLSNNSENYYLFGFISYFIYEEYDFTIQIHRFKSLHNFLNESTLIKFNTNEEAIDNEKSSFSCFQTEKLIIICFFLSNSGQYIITAYDINLDIKTKIILSFTNIIYSEIFYKCIHLKEEIGVFFYYQNFGNIYYPVLLFKQYSENDLNIKNYTIPEIIINKINIQFNVFILLNDIIKLNKNKICLCLYENNNTYIILINLFEDSKYKVRYYSINLYNLYGYKIHSDIRCHNYNNFIVLAFSHLENDNNDVDTNVALIFFSYSNSTDNNIYLDEYLTSNSSLNNIEINLENEVRIENNIFGYIFSGIEINNLLNCGNLNLISILNNQTIHPNYILSKNEKIKMEFSGINYNAFICNLQYYYIITEPDLDEYDMYPILIDGYNETNDINYEKEEYYGRLTYYNITLKQNLSSECNDITCNICFMNNKSFCIEYNSNFSYEGKMSEKESSEDLINGTNNDNYVEYVEDYKALDLFINESFLINNNIKEIDNISIKIRNEILNGDMNLLIYNVIKEKKDYNIKINNVIYQISSTENQNNENYENISLIQLEECEKELKNQYNISKNIPLLIFKLDIYEEGLLIPIVEYELYNSETRQLLNLTICSNIKINILLPAKIKGDKNRYDSSNDYYNNICYIYYR